MEGEGWIALPQLRVETQLAALGRGEGPPGQPLNVPIVPASFRAGSSGTTGRAYARDDGTPGWEAFEQLFSDLEGGPAVCFASGMAAISAVFELLPVGARVVVPQDTWPRGPMPHSGNWIIRPPCWNPALIDVTKRRSCRCDAVATLPSEAGRGRWLSKSSGGDLAPLAYVWG